MSISITWASCWEWIKLPLTRKPSASALPSASTSPGKRAGLIPTKQWKLSRLKEPWQQGETISIAIGQGFNLVTPLQLVNVYATLGNGGTLYRPRLVKQLESSGGPVIKEYGPEKLGALPLSPQTIQIINKALWGVVNERGGTGSVLKRKEADVCRKDGNRPGDRTSAGTKCQKGEASVGRFPGPRTLCLLRAL